MLLRRVAPAALAILALSACEPGVGYDPGRNQTTNYAVFDPSTSQIPQPNDLALTQAGSLPGAQGELLRLFVAAGGFPNDQEVPITIDFVQVGTQLDGGVLARTMPALDISSISMCPAANCNLAVMVLAASPSFVTVDQPVATDYVANGDHGTLTVHRSAHAIPSGSPGSTINSRVWDAGVHYVAAIRGGPNGVTVNNGQKILPQPAMYILEQGKDLTLPENQGLIPGNTAAERAANAAQLEQLRRTYEAGPFPILSAAAFPKTEIATMTTFQIAPRATTAPSAQPVVDASAGVVPLPSNLLLDGSTLPDDPLAPATNARVQNIPTFGPLASGLATLDGFSTTAFLIVPTSAPVVVALGPDPSPASQFTNNVFLYDLSDPNNPAPVNPSTYDDLLPGPGTPAPARQETSTGSGIWVSAVVGVQPAAATKPNTSKPLKEATEYAFIVTKRIVGALDQRPLGRPTVASIVLFDNPIWAGGHSQLAGVSDAQAKVLERMRVQIAKILPDLQTHSTTKADIAIAYTFRTQTITTPALQLAAAPYDPARNPGVNFLSTPAALAPQVLTPNVAFTKYGVEPSVILNGQSLNILEVIDASLPTPNLLSNATGAFDPTLLGPGANPPINIIPALIAVPDLSAIPVNNLPPNCPPPANALRCAPLVVFHHGLNGGRAQMLLTANELAAHGFVVAAIDAPKHGDRSLCSTDPSVDAMVQQCASGSTCQAIPGAATQGDAFPPGQCKLPDASPGQLQKHPVLCITSNCTTTATDGVANASGNYLLSANLFRFRDTLRQDIIDNSGLILALARPPSLPATTTPNPVAAELLSKGIVVDPAHVFWEGQSLGGILGTINVAVNPRISEAVLNVPGGTFVDIAITSPNFRPGILSILHNIPPPQGPIDPGTAAFLQFLQVAKWVFDPAEPINFAGHLLGDTAHPALPNLLAPGTAQTPKSVLGQMAVCDPTIPNPFNLLLFNVAGLGQNVPNEFEIFRNTSTPVAGGDCLISTPPVFSSGAVAHGFLLDHGLPSGDVNNVQISQDARNFAAAFLADPTAVQPPLDQK